MKKLMIGAAAAAMAVTSFGELCIEDTVAEGCAVYNVKFSFKTLVARKNSNCGLTWLVDSALTRVWTRTDLLGQTIDDDSVKAGGVHNQTVFPRVRAAKRQLWWMDNGTRKFEGILWQCEAQCFEGAWIRNLPQMQRMPSRINCAIWEKATKTSLTLPVLRYYTKKDRSQYGWFTRDAERDFNFLGRYGQKATKVAARWVPQLVANQWIDAAGFGSFNGKGFVKSISGNAVAMLRPYNTDKDVCGPTRFFVQIAPMCEEFIQWCCDQCYFAVETVPASGTWSIKYNSSLSKGKKSLAKILPDYAVFGPNRYTLAQWRRIQGAINTLLPTVFLENNGYFYVAPLYAAASEKEANAAVTDDVKAEFELDQELEVLSDLTFDVVALESDADVENKAWDAEKLTIVVDDEEKGTYHWEMDGTAVTGDNADDGWKVAEQEPEE